MKKFTLLFAFFMVMTTQAQMTLEVLSYPTKFSKDATDNTIVGPTVGENALVIRYKNVPNIAQNSPVPIRTAAQTATDLSAVTLPSTGDCTGLLGTAFNPGGGNIGFTSLHQVNYITAVLPTIINRVQNGDGTWNFTVVHTRFTNAAYITDTEYATIQRSFYAVPEPGAIAVKPNGSGGFAVAGMKFLAPSAALNPVDSEANLIAKANATLGVYQVDGKKLSSFYPNPVKDIITIGNDVQTKTYKVLSLTGAILKDVPATGTLNVSDLASGTYILATDVGTAKFIKE